MLLYICMKEILNLENGQEKVRDFTSKFILGEKTSKNFSNKKELYQAIQSQWKIVLNEEELLPRNLNENTGLDAIKNICSKLSKTQSGFGTSPGLHKMIAKEYSGLDCVATSMILASYLEDNNIKYNYVSPVSHIALLVEIKDGIYYVDARNNKVVEISNFIKEIDTGSEAFSRIDLRTKEEDKTYSFMFRFNNKEDIIDSIVGNIFVLNELTKGIDEGAAHDVNSHKKAAESIKNELSKVNWTLIEKQKIFNKEEDFHEKNKDLIEKEEERLNKVGFYE